MVRENGSTQMNYLNVFMEYECPGNDESRFGGARQELWR